MLQQQSRCLSISRNIISYKMKKIKIDRQEIHEKFDGHCAYCWCEITVKEMQIDHIIPKANFEMFVWNSFRVPSFLKHLRLWHENHTDNLFPACRKCNHYKSTFDLETFRKELWMQLTRLQENTNFKLAKKYSQIIENPQPITFYFEKYVRK